MKPRKNRERPTRDFYRPKSYTAKIRPRKCRLFDLPGVEVFCYEEENKLFAVGFSGKRQKPDFHHRFLSSETREAFVRAYFESLRVGHNEDSLSSAHRYKRIQALYRLNFDAQREEFYAEEYENEVANGEHEVEEKEDEVEEKEYDG